MALPSSLSPGLDDVNQRRATGEAIFPWLDFASAEMPVNHVAILWYAHHLWTTDGTYRTAMSRVADHFLTSLEFPDLELDEESAFKDFYTDTFNYRRVYKLIAENFLAYGNVFVAPYLPFNRFLRCTQCNLETAIQHTDYVLDLSASAPYVSWRRTAACKQCGSTQPFSCHDRKNPDLTKFRLNTYSPFEIEIAYNRHSGAKDVFWKIAEDDRADIRSKAKIFIETTPLEILEAVARNTRFRFDQSSILHLSEDSIAGFKARGWGLPRALSCFRAGWLQQVFNRADQAIAKDYTLGMRLISPELTAGGQDPMKVEGMAQFVRATQSMVSNHRANPASFHTSPYPLKYQFLGGEGAQLLPFEKLKFRHQEFLSQLGVPLDFHQMNMTSTAAPMSLRLFEAAWQSIPALYNHLIKWNTDTISRTYGLPPTKVKFVRSTTADDEMRKQLMLQLMSAKQVSAQTALAPFDTDVSTEIRRVYKEQELQARVEQEFADKQQTQSEMGAVRQLAGAPTATTAAQQQQQAAQGPQGGAPGGGGAPATPAGTANTLEGVSAQAKDLADQIVRMPEQQRKQKLKEIRESSKELHALVTKEMERIRTDAGAQGRAQLAQGQ